MLSLLRRFFGGDRPSGQVARKRMQFVLMHDRIDITPDILEAIRKDMLAVLSKYMEIDSKSLKVDIEQGKDFMALISNVQVKRVYRHAMSN